MGLQLKKKQQLISELEESLVLPLITDKTAAASPVLMLPW